MKMLQIISHLWFHHWLEHSQSLYILVWKHGPKYVLITEASLVGCLSGLVMFRLLYLILAT